MADQSYRDLYDEVATLRQEMDRQRGITAYAEHCAAQSAKSAEQLRQELDDTKADLRRLVDELAEANRRLEKTREQRDTWRTMHHEVEVQRAALGPVVEAAKAYYERFEWLLHHDRGNVAAAPALSEEPRFRLLEAVDVLLGRAVVSAPLISADAAKIPQPGGNESELRRVATRVVQLVTHGADGLVVGEAIAEMRRVLDGGGW